MKRRVALIALLAAASSASAQLLYEPFDYPAGALLEGQTNPETGTTWNAVLTGSTATNVTVTSGSLPMPAGMPAGVGNSVSYQGSGSAERIGWGSSITSGTVYFSLSLNVTDLSNVTFTTSVASFEPSAGGAIKGEGTPQQGARLAVQKLSPTTYSLGIASSGIAFALESGSHTVGTPLFVVGSYTFNSGTGNDTASFWVSPTLNAYDLDAAPAASANAAPATDVPQIAGFGLHRISSVPAVTVDELRVGTSWRSVTPHQLNQWNTPNDHANWSSSANWIGPVPNAPTAWANLLNDPSGHRTIELDVPVTLQTLVLDHAAGYTIQKHAIDNPSGGGTPYTGFGFNSTGLIRVKSGEHTFNADVSLNSSAPVTFDVAAGASLAAERIVALGTGNVQKSGGGTLSLDSLLMGSNSQINISGGTVHIAQPVNAMFNNPTINFDLSNAGTQLNLSAGGKVNMLRVRPGTKVSVGGELGNALNVYSLLVDSTGGTIDLGEGHLAVRSWSSSVPSVVKKGYNGGAWDGDGINSPVAGASGGVYSLGWLSAWEKFDISGSQTAVWHGMTVTANSVLVDYTWGGDADLDGDLDGDDYFYLDSHIMSGVGDWHDGDFNYDGFLNGDDYFVIDSNILYAQAVGPLYPSSGVSAVPEPALALPILGVALLLKRRTPGPRTRGFAQF